MPDGLDLGLEFVLTLQSTRNDLFDFLAQAFDWMGTDLFYLIVLPIIFWTIDRRLGTRLLFAVIVGGLLNTILKNAFQLPRPGTVSDEVFVLVEAMGYGLPSGHVMVALVAWGYVALYARQRWVTAVVIVYVLIMGWARMYAGVHFPLDVLAGALFGLLTLALYAALIRFFGPIWPRFNLSAQIAIVVIAVLFSLVWVLTDVVGVTLVGLLLGTGLGVIIESRWVHFIPTQDTGKKIAMYLVGVIVIALVFFGLSELFDVLAQDGTAAATLLRLLRYGLVTLTAYCLWPWLAIRLSLADTQ